MTDDDLQEAQAYESYLEDAREKPVKYIKHDVTAHDDEALYRFVNAHGMAYYGWYWLLAELLAGRKGHCYDVSDELGWRKLKADLSCMCDMNIAECKAFVNALLNAGLISSEHFTEMHQVVIKRINRDAYSYAEFVARKKTGAFKTNRKRWANGR